jgi:pSer/pThr/pTyr-binding forkhead associated (FHA) protein
MPYIQFNDQQFPLTAEELTVGAYDGATVRLPGNDASLRAVLMVGADGTGLVRRGGPQAAVFVNGVQLGAEPSPLLHGDKLSLGSYELRYGDDVRGGSTQFVSGADVRDAVKARANAPSKPTTDTGGRLVSLVDGREYPVPDTGVTFGREIGNDIVIGSTEVSRKHARIAPGEGGYVVVDLSTNGMTVNGVRVEKTRLLGRGDVLKIGPEEYRFYADVAKAPATAQPAAAAPRPAPATPRPAPAAPQRPPAPPRPAPAAPQAITAERAAAPRQPVAAERAPAAAPSAPAPASTSAPRPAPRPPALAEAATGALGVRKSLATLEVINEGPMKGTKFELFTPLTNIGRGPHNDVVLGEESVSDSHAKILKRDGGWWLVDQGSTNGTYIGGRRVQGEQQIVGVPDVRFGSVKMMFKSVAVRSEDEGKGTRAIVAPGADAAKKAAERKRAAMPAPQPGPAQLPAEKKKGCMAMIAFLLALGVAGASMTAILLSARG